MIPERVAMQYEPSTVEMINRLGKHKKRDIWDELEEQFDFSTIGWGTATVRVLKKKLKEAVASPSA